MASPGKSSFPVKAVALLLGVFLLGALAGAGGLALGFRHYLQALVRMDHPHPRARDSFLRIGQVLSKRLDLNAAESAAVQQEMGAAIENLSRLRVNMQQDLRAETEATLQRIAARLPEEKRPLLRQIARQRLAPWGLLDEKRQE